VTIKKSKARTQFQADDVADPENLRRVLNDFLLDTTTRLEALEQARGMLVLPDVTFETGGAVAAGTAPFTADGAGVKVTCPEAPTGVVLLSLRTTGSAAISANASDVKWHYAAGASSGAGDGVLHIDFVTGLAINSRYLMRLAVTRA